MGDRKKSKIFNDPVHGHVEMHELCVKIIDTPQFQRLRYIKQLGGCYFVYPGAAHNRFEHSIGTAHLAGVLAESLKSRQEGLGITDKDVLCVKIAGLCHDLGHGPFSHLFDRSFIPKVAEGADKDWRHEKASLAMVKLIFDNLKKEDPKNFGLEKGDIKFIEELIDGQTEGSDEDDQYKERKKKKGFLFQIISNKDSGIDVDKWDYFARDCYHLGMKSSFDHMRCIKMARVIKDDDNKWHICFRDKEVHNIYEMFHVRSILHRRAYQHKTSNAVELMITDALVKADPYLEFEGKDGKKLMSEAIHDMVAYTKITDQVYHQILHASDQQLDEARKILERIERRELYRSIEEHTTEKDISRIDVDKGTLEIANKSGVAKEDIILDKVKFDYGMKEKDPVKNVYFYKKEDPDKPIKIEEDKVSYMLPKVFLEWKIRLYLRKTELDEVKTKQLIKGFGEWFKKVKDVKEESAAGSSGAAGREDETPEKKRSPEEHDGAPAKKKLEY